MRIGTFWCWLWGHKMVGKDYAAANRDRRLGPVRRALNFCVRCGKEKLNGIS